LLVAGSSSKLCSVRGTVRSQDKADAWEKKHAGEFKKGQLEWSIGKGAFDEAIKGVDIVAHTASPFVSLSAYSAVLRRPS
jgi:hypothetical protein